MTTTMIITANTTAVVHGIAVTAAAKNTAPSITATTRPTMVVACASLLLPRATGAHSASTIKT